MTTDLQFKDFSVDTLVQQIVQFRRDGFDGRFRLIVHRSYYRCPVGGCTYYTGSPAELKRHILGDNRKQIAQLSECGEALAGDMVVVVRKSRSNACADERQVRDALASSAHALDRIYIVKDPEANPAASRAAPQPRNSDETARPTRAAQIAPTLVKRTVSKRTFCRVQAPAAVPRVTATPVPRSAQPRPSATPAREEEEVETKPSVHAVDDDEEPRIESLADFYSTQINGVPRATGIPQTTFDQLENCWINPVLISQCTSAQYKSLLMDTPQLAGIPIGQRFVLWTGVEATYFKQ